MFGISGGRRAGGSSVNLAPINAAIAQLTLDITSLQGTITSQATEIAALEAELQTKQRQSGASYYVLFEEFDTGTTAGQWGWTASNSGTSAASSIHNPVPSDKAIGVALLSTGTTATGRCALSLGLTSYIIGVSKIDFETRIKMDATSNVTQGYNFYAGLIDNTAAAGDVTDGIYFVYNDTVSPNWYICSANNGVRTQVNTGVAATTNWLTLSFSIREDGSRADFYINGVLAGIVNSNMPTSSGRNSSIGLKIEKKVGATASTAKCDYVKVESSWSVAR